MTARRTKQSGDNSQPDLLSPEQQGSGGKPAANAGELGRSKERAGLGRPGGDSKGQARKRTTKASRQEFFIPVTGFVWLYPEEVEVVNHPTFQRLGRIYQLGQTYLVYRGATHKRLEHTLGALHVVQRMIEAVRHTSEKAEHQGDPCGATLNDEEERFIRLGALLHDIGHVAAGHTVEDELCLMGKHDQDGRLDLLFVDGSRTWVDAKDRTLGEVIDSEFAIYVPRDLVKSGVAASEIVRLLIRKPPRDDEADSHREAFSLLKQSHSLRLNICRDMIGNTICADLLDYLHRDWYHVGKPRPFDERILQYMEIRTNRGDREVGSPEPRADDRFVISLGRRPKIRTDAVSAILELLEWRYQLAETVLFHRTKLAAAGMLDRALYELWNEYDSNKLESFLLPLSDEQVVRGCKDEAEKLANDKSDSKRERGCIAATLLTALEKRELFKNLVTLTFDDLPPHVRSAIQRLYGNSETTPNRAPTNRANALRLLERDFQLPAGSLAMYCPTAAMNAKIAQVHIAVNDEIEKFSAYEEKYDNQLSGGHLHAQLRRFKRLWRVHFFIDRQLNLSGEVLYVLREAVKKLVLGHLAPEEDNVQVVRSLAALLTVAEGSTFNGWRVDEHLLIAAHGNSAVVGSVYPAGFSTIRSCLRKP
jgi:HD superfamily phosphohydrolase